MQKNFVFDTNVLLHDPRAIFKFEDNNIIIPIYVIEEIDTFKKEMTELGRNAREASRMLDRYRMQGKLGEGVELENGGTLRVPSTTRSLDKEFLHSDKKDNLILAVALDLQGDEPDKPCILLTKDVNLRIRANALGIRSENYEEQDVSISELYPGACELDVPVDMINGLHEDGELEVDLTQYQPKVSESAERGAGEVMPRFYPNEYVLLKNEAGGNQNSLGRITLPNPDDPSNARIQPLFNLKSAVWGLRPRNKEQYFALDALLDDDIKLVTLIGKAGTGKTILAIAAGLRKVTDEQKYGKLVVSRPIFPMGRDIGYLPGTVEEKLNPWMRPIFDNVEHLMGVSTADKRAGRGAQELIDMGIIEIEPLTYIRGRSLPNLFLIVDEAQNLTPHEVKTILTRVGEGTKIVLTGDPYQIDNPYVDSESNGLTYVVTKFKNEPISATVSMFKGERSELAELAANIL
ncbi:PhoH family protein [Persicimonas caeni]|uniref:PhoH family protein n=1 Tax=Persicimonas caeni TaxID=2292766 RepID=A0A4Y6PXA0_PERCE|nr:PhoH family protein [Persicimonas caeni]QDG52951.1 PhoH family protein [Persicimonas caeni]QED34173.1 PhoH family protein [Persicimonas caeni]